MKKVLMTILMVAAAAVIGCGNGTTADDDTVTSTVPAVSSLTDGGGTAVEATGTVGVNPTSFTVTFSEAMDDATVTSDTVTYACGSLANAILSFSFNEAKTILTITVADAYKYQLLECILTFTTDVKDAEATAMATTTYTSTNKCAVNDDFNADSQSCWTVDDGEDLTWTLWSEILANVLTFNTSEGTLDYSDATVTGESAVLINKTASLSATSLEIILHIESVSGITGSDEVKVSLTNEEGTAFLMVLVGTAGGTQSCKVSYGNEDSGVDSRYAVPCPAGSGYHVRFYMGADTTELQYKADGDTDYANLEWDHSSDPFPSSFADILNGLGTSPALGVAFDSNGGQDNLASVGSILTSGITVEGQY